MVRPLLRSLAVVPLLSAIGCGALLGIPPSDSQEEDEDGRGGTSAAGSGGHGAGGGAGEGGAGDSSGATTGGTGEAGSLSTGGSGGNGGSTEGGSSGMAGSAGEGGNDSDFPQPNEPCSASGAFACYFADPDQPLPTLARLECVDGKWVERSEENCPNDEPNPQRCDRRDGTCAIMACTRDQQPGEWRAGTCFRSVVQVCGPDLVTLEDEPCIFGCAAGDCNGAAPGKLVIDRPRSVIGNGSNPWPKRLIPVCWREFPVDDQDIIEARAHVRVAVESLWSRESAVGFTGWESCDASQARVELDFADECQGELARLPRDGYPGDQAALPVTLCKTYYDFGPSPMRHPPMGTDTIELDLLGFVAQHVFGHVLGLADVVEDAERGLYFMDPVLELTKFAELRPERGLRERLAQWYGRAPGRSLVSPNGRCLSYESGVLSTAACDGSDAQAWLPLDDALAHGSGKCVSGPVSGGTLEIAECSAEPLEEKAWLPARVHIQNRVDHCLKAGTLPNDLALEWVDCDASWSVAEQRFRFGFVAPGRVRIRATHTTPERCIVAPREWTQPSSPEFGSCDDVRAVFDAFEGTLGQEGHCLTLTTPEQVGLVVFEPCGTASNQQFYFSGPFERDGYALTFPMAEQPVVLGSSPLGSSPTREQIFDYRF